MILRKVNCGIRRFVQGAFCDLFDVDTVHNAWDKHFESKNREEGRGSYLTLNDSR